MLPPSQEERRQELVLVRLHDIPVEIRQEVADSITSGRYAYRGIEAVSIQVAAVQPDPADDHGLWVTREQAREVGVDPDALVTHAVSNGNGHRDDVSWSELLPAREVDSVEDAMVDAFLRSA